MGVKASAGVTNSEMGNRINSSGFIVTNTPRLIASYHQGPGRLKLHRRSSIMRTRGLESANRHKGVNLIVLREANVSEQRILNPKYPEALAGGVSPLTHIA